ncbi:hypothetical protein BH11ACT4_BH11ACT4_04350 [soil metagenome]
MTTRGSAAGLRRTARIDLAALRTNLTRQLEADDSFILDARADAYGHGAAVVVPLALDLGVSTVRVSPGAAAIAGVKRSSLMTVPSRRALVGEAAYGLDGRGRPVMTLSGEVVSAKPTEAGVGVSYGYTYRTADDTVLALVALGYADGVPRLASNTARVFVGGGVHPLVGRVAMDQFVVDVGSTSPVAVGDEAVLFGDAAAGHPLALDWAGWTGRSALELTAGIGSRVRRLHVEGALT